MPEKPKYIPTTADSLMLYNNALALNKFYKKQGYKAEPVGNIYSLQDVKNTNQGLGRTTVKDPTKGAAVMDPESLKKVKAKAFETNDYISTPDIFNSLINPNAPNAIFHKHIKPKGFIAYSKDVAGAAGTTDQALIPNYPAEQYRPRSIFPDPIKPKENLKLMNPYMGSRDITERSIDYKPKIEAEYRSYNTYGNPNAPMGYIQDKTTGAKVNVQNADEMSRYKQDFNFAEGGNMNPLQDYYGSLLQKESDRNKKIASGAGTLLGTGVGALLGNPMLGMQIGSTAGDMVGNLFANGGNLTEIPGSAGTHENNPNGGVNIENYGASVEGNETIFNQFVYSDRLSPIGSKKTYAQMSKNLNKKLKLRPDDKITKTYVEGELEKLAQDQEAQKTYMDIIKQAKGTLKQMMKLGGKMYAEGGDLTSKRNMMKDELLTLPELDLGLTPKTNFDNSGNISQISYFNPSLYNNVNPELIDSTNNELFRGTQASSDTTSPVAKTKSKKFNASKALPYTQLLGPASQMLTSLLNRNSDLAKLNYRTPEFTPVDEFYAAKIADQGVNRALATTNAAIRDTSNTQGAYISNILAANAQALSNPSQAANLAYSANVANTTGRNQNNILAADITNRNIDEREKSIDNSREEVTNALYNTGAIVSGLYRDNARAAQDKKTNELFLNTVGSITPNYTVDESGNIIFKQDNKYGGKMKKC